MTLAAAARAWIAENPNHTELTLRQLALLDLIATEGPQQTKIAASKLGVSKPVMTRACISLEGYVERRTLANDARLRVIALTAAGQSLIGLMRKAQS